MKQLVAALKEHDNYIIVGHEHPDPDSLGSMLGLYFGLKQIGKKCRMVSGDPVPRNLTWPGLEYIEHIPNGFEPAQECIIVVDCEPARTGSIAPGVQKAKCLFNIDHHRGSRGSGHVVYVDPAEAATSVIIYRILKELDIHFDKEIATALYGGIVGDTGGFRYANTTSEVLRIASELVTYGVEPDTIAREIFASQTWSFMKLLGFALNNLQRDVEGKLVWMTVSYEDFKRFNADPVQTDHLVQYARMVDTTEIAIVFREVEPGEIRIGFRANSVDVERLARHFGGGGHKLASGAKIMGELDTVAKEVITTARHYLTKGELNERNH